MFEHGTKWVNADFHLHTNVDKQFMYNGNQDFYYSDYIDKLVEEDIQVGAITNHNKFDTEEYLALWKTAKKRDVILLPGVELSVNEGRNGLHCLIVFDKSNWIPDKNARYIEHFLDTVFKGIDNREHADKNCPLNLNSVLEELEKYNKDYFVIMAHVDDNNGLFKECSTSSIRDLSNNILFEKRVLGFQKSRSRDDKDKIFDAMGRTIALVEGSDCKSIKDIGQTGLYKDEEGKIYHKKSHIKIGDSNFESIVLALKDFTYRVSPTKPKYQRGFIKSANYIGGKLNGQTVNFSPELNNLIGIRGSGKSSIIETIRYALDIEPSSSDNNYKNNLVKNTLGSGGEITLNVCDKVGKEYKITRIYGEPPQIKDPNNDVIDIPLNTILENPLYFGQKDLSSTEENFEMELIDKMVGKKIDTCSSELREIEDNIIKDISNLIKIWESNEDRTDLETELKGIRHQIETYDENGIAEKLSEQVNYQADLDFLNQNLTNIEKVVSDISEKLSSNEVSLIGTKYKNHSFKTDSEILSNYQKYIDDLLNEISKIESSISNISKIKSKLTELKDNLNRDFVSKKDDFAEIKRQINIKNIDIDYFPKLKEKERLLETKIFTEESKLKKEVSIKTSLMNNIEERNQILKKVFHDYEREIKKINDGQDYLKLKIEFKGNKVDFKNNLKKEFTGSGVTDIKYGELSEEFSDFIAILQDIFINESKKIKNIVTEGQFSKIKELVIDNFSKYIKIPTENKTIINYHGSPLKGHSIGQRASAIMLLILMQTENDLIIIDQPEDDLDNQVIYKEIITTIKGSKSNVQFIFATHNANIPVLGDADQVISVRYENEYIDYDSGSIDKKDVQKKIIYIMEGGPDAFRRRNAIYDLWKNT